jgi:hypothetical protein
MTALIIGTAIALLAVAFVLVPLFREDADTDFPAQPAGSAERRPDDEDAVGALREIEFDRATGKLSDADYAVLKTRYTADALDAMRAADSEAVLTDPSDLAEEAILRYRTRAVGCAVCGPRPEPDAVYCSTCGRYLPGRCNGCGADASQPGARFCVSCGKTLAA